MNRSKREATAPRLCALILLLACLASRPTLGQTLTNLGITPLPEMSYGTYKSYAGGLYPNYANNRPPAHFAAGMMIATNQIQPLDPLGSVNTSTGKVVMLSIGMSNTTDEFASLGPSAFKLLADGDPSKNPRLVIVDGAQGGQASTDWTNFNSSTWSTVASRLASAGVTTNQVQVLWMKHARRQPEASGAFPLHAQALQGDEEIILRDAKLRYPNLKIAYLSSRTRAYVYTTNSGSSELNPEPYAFESCFSVKWLIEKQINGDLNYDTNKGPTIAPWLSWGPYLWVDGTTPRGDGFIWVTNDLQSDFTHPSATGGVPKVAHELLAFFKTDPTATPWFLRKPIAGQPTVVASADVTNGIAPLKVRFNASVTGSVSQVVWTFDDGEFSEAQNPTNIFRTSGVYAARVTVTGANSNTASSSIAITVNTTFNDWRTNKFSATELTNAAISGASANPDLDAFPNLLEYAMGLEPKTSNSADTVSMSLSNGVFVLSFPHLKASTDVALTAQSSTDFSQWAPVAPAQILDRGPLETIVVNQAIVAAQARFFRLQAQLLP